ncbi:MAG: DUF6177 family protein [Arachnia sp.]
MAPPPSVDLPGVDEITDTYTVFSTQRRVVGLTPALAEFLAMSELEGLQPVVHTGWDAAISAQASLELGRHWALWTSVNPEGELVDVLGRRVLQGFDEALAPGEAMDTTEVPPVPPEAKAAVSFELMVQHPASAGLLVGGPVEEVFEALDGQAPDSWGSTEPFSRAWSRSGLTQFAQSQMPKTSIIRGGSPDHSWFTTTLERSPHGLVERLRGGVIVGPYDKLGPRAAERAADLLRALHESQQVTMASTSLIDVDPDGAQRVRATRAEVPLATIVGPWALSQAQVDVPAVQQEFGARDLGSQEAPALLFRFDAPHPNPWHNFTEVAASIGLESLLATVGLRVPPTREQVNDGS